jgi:elongation factor 3
LPCGKGGLRADAAKLAVLESCPKAVEDDIVHYLADMASMLVEDEDATPRRTTKELEGAFSPLLEEYGVALADVEALCQMVASASFATVRTSERKEVNATSMKSEALDALCCVPNMMLMYGGSPEPLLHNTTFELLRGHRYGVVGTNGSGKTTLMERIAKKDIVGFPDTVKVVHLKHDSIMEGVDAKTTVKDYAVLQCGIAAHESVTAALLQIGFDGSAMEKIVVSLSGGWQMRLALACAMAQNANLFLLDEPTNHLDAEAVSWLVEFVNNTCSGQDGRTAMIVSHDSNFLDRVCTDVIHFSPNGKLNYHCGNFTTFRDFHCGGDYAKADLMLETSLSGPLGISMVDIDRMIFPTSKLGSAAKTASILTFKTSSFQYSNTETPVLTDVDVKLTASSRVGIVGKNGSGKSTLLALLAARLKSRSADAEDSRGLWWHRGLRLAFVAQHSFVHLGEYGSMTPLEYIQLRFRRGFDMEASDFEASIPSPPMTDRMAHLASRHGKSGKGVEALLSRIDCEDHFLYEVKWKGLSDAQNSFEKIGRLKELGVDEMAKALDERLFYTWAGANPRPLTTREIVQHLEAFGFSEEMTSGRKICMLSSGQRCKLAFGAAFWTRPHVLCLDEPTNYLDVQTTEVLSHALRSFRGACVLVSHSLDFVHETCTEIWEVADGKVVTQTPNTLQTKLPKRDVKTKWKSRLSK